MATLSRKAQRTKRHRRIRNSISGTAERPRMAVSVSNKRVYVQFIDDTTATTLAAVSTFDKDATAGKTLADAKSLGERAAKAAQDKGIQEVVLDRAGFKYHGRIKALADAVREAGIRL